MIRPARAAVGSRRRSLRAGVLSALLALGVVSGGVTPSSPQASAALTSAGPGTFTVPLINSVAADPSITFHDGRYHMIYNKPGHNEQIVVRTSASLATMRTGQDHIVYDGAQNPADIRCGIGLGAWLMSWGGRWYLFGWGDNCNGWHTARPFVAESVGSDILGPYAHKTTFSSPAPEIGGDGHGYAASPLRIGSRTYLAQTSNGRIFLARLTNPWTLATTGWHRIAQAESLWECAGGRCLDEGGSVVVRGGRVFLIFSAGGYESPDYCVGMLEASTGSDLLQQSSWTKSSNCVFRRNDSAGVYGPASMIFFKSPDRTEDWVVYHVKTTTELTGADRYLQAKKVTWGTDGRPRFGAPLAMGAAQQVPSGDHG